MSFQIKFEMQNNNIKFYKCYSGKLLFILHKKYNLKNLFV